MKHEQHVTWHVFHCEISEVWYTSLKKREPLASIHLVNSLAYRCWVSGLRSYPVQEFHIISRMELGKLYWICFVWSLQVIDCKIALHITLFMSPKKLINEIQYWHISPSFYEVHMKEQGDVSYKDDVASWDDLAQSRHCPHLLKRSSIEETIKQAITHLSK